MGQRRVYLVAILGPGEIEEFLRWLATVQTDDNHGGSYGTPPPDDARAGCRV